MCSRCHFDFSKVILYWSIDWAIKANILRKNLEKLVCPPNDSTYTKNALIFLGQLLLEAALSWINVIIICGRFQPHRFAY